MAELEADAELRATLAAKAVELFALCDAEGKGYIVRRDMHRLCDLLPLTADQIECVFDKLDQQSNGRLTLEEFTNGFGSFVGIYASSHSSAAAAAAEESANQGSTGENSVVHCRGVAECDEYCLDEDEHFQKTVNKLVSSGVFQDEESLRGLWSRLKTEQPDLVPCLECLLVSMTEEIAKSHTSYRNLEKTMRTKMSAYEEEMRRLYEEMEAQVRAERARVLAEQRLKEKQLRDEMEREIREREKLCQELMQNHESLERRLAELNQAHSESAQENERLGRERDALEAELADSRDALNESRAYVDELQRKLKEDRRHRAMSAMRLTEGLALERENLVRQLEMLRDDNRRLRDVSDMAAGQNGRGGGSDEIVHFREGDESRDFNRQESLQGLLASAAVIANGETLADIMGGPDDGCEFDDMSRVNFPPLEDVEIDDLAIDDPTMIVEDEEEVEIDEELICASVAAVATAEALRRRPPVRETAECATMVTPCPSPPPFAAPIVLPLAAAPQCEIEVQTEEPLKVPTPLPLPLPLQPFLPLQPLQLEPLPLSPHSELNEVRVSPEGAGDDEEFLGTESMSEAACFAVTRAPERVFKIVFIGDSGVGKSSVIHRLCQNAFKSTFAATIGIDFQVKAMELEGQVIALQLWDTAGQERFRSITKQYFRKADGIVIVYDVTNDQSYMHLREWLDCVQEGDGDEAVKLLLGNKIDLLSQSKRPNNSAKEQPTSRAVEAEAAKKLADHCNESGDAPTLFFEVSAKSGASVGEAFVKFARLLLEREDRQMRNAIKISSEIEKKKGCCP